MRNLVLVGLILTIALGAEGASGKFPKFDPKQPDVRNLGVWRLTNDPAVRDHASYHNIQCWSPDGRYTCYTRLPKKKKGHRTPAEIHVVDLHTGEDRLVATFARHPRWANRHNWLFYARYTNDGPPIFKWTSHIRFGIDLVRYDADTGEKVVITREVEFPGGLDATDSLIFGVQIDRRTTPPKRCVVRVRNRPGSKLEYLRDAPDQHQFVQVNPVHPVIMARTFKHITDRVYSRQRTLYDFDGKNHRTAFIWAEVGHNCWSSDGKYMLNGNRQVQGRPWNKPYPSDPEILAWGVLGDISPCSRSGRYMCGDAWPDSLAFADTRSGDYWTVVRPYSGLIWPFKGDNSTLT